MLDASGRSYVTPFERALLIARRNWLLLLVCFLVVPAAALAYSLAQTPEYTASASLLFTEKDASQRDPERAAATNLALVSLDQVAVRTAQKLGDEIDVAGSALSEKVSVSAAGESDLVKVEATDPDPDLAATIANEFARQFIAFRRDANRAKVQRALGLIEARLDELPQDQLDSPEAGVLEDQQRDLAVRATLQTGEAQLVQPAVAPDSPSSPKTTRNVALGILLGLVLGISLALLRDQFDRRLKTVQEAEDLFRLSTLATIPESRQIGRDEGIGPAPAGETGEAFRMLRANLQYFGIDRELKSVLITSPASEDGKTMVAWNLAVMEAAAGKRILFLEADLRRPTLGEHLPLPSDMGLGLVLSGGLEAETAIERVHGVDVLAAGPLPPNPADLLDSENMERLLEWAEGEYDRVVVDTPPAVVVADALPLIKKVDRMLVVVRLGRTARDAAERLRAQLANVEAPVLGLVINGAASQPDQGYYRSPGASDSFAAMQEKIASSNNTEGAARSAQSGQASRSGSTQQSS